MKNILLGLSVLSLLSPAVYAEENHAQMNHSMHMAMMTGGLTEAGNDAFGTIQEVIRHLNQDPNTDWSKVNLEALREHLVDMQDMTMNVEVGKKVKIKNGLQVFVQPSTKHAAGALARVFAAHPPQLKRETGWDMKVQKQGKGYLLRITTSKPEEVDKIRGLGYIGLMAYGSHHQAHHWMMARGINPHRHN